MSKSHSHSLSNSNSPTHSPSKPLSNFSNLRKKPKITLTTPEPPVHQSFKDETNINNIIARSRANSGLAYPMPDAGLVAASQYGDFTQHPTFEESLLKVNAAKEMFRHLPANMRKRLGNDPGELLRLSNTPEGCEELCDLGLLKRNPPPAPADPIEPSKGSKKASKPEATE